MSVNQEIPNGWETVLLGEFLMKHVGAVDPSKHSKETFDLYSIPAYDSKTPEVLQGSQIGSTKKIVQENDVLISRIVPHIQRSWVVPASNGRRQIGSGEWIIFRGTEFVPHFMKYYLLSADFHRKFMTTISGVGGSLTRANPAQVARFTFPLPPLPEQHRIVAKIEEMFSSLDKGIESLKTAQQQLKVYRQAVLKWAFEGKLTKNSLRQAQGTVIPVVEPVETTFPQEGSLPRGWKWMRLGEISEMCLGKMLDKAKNKGDLQPYLRNISVRWGTFDLSDLEKMRFEEFENERFSLKKGDLVICEGGEPGRCAIWISNESMYIQKALHRVRMHNGYDTKYIFYFTFFSALNGHLGKYFTGTTIKHLTGKELKKVTIPIPLALPEQQAIVAEIESRLSVCDKIEESIEQSLKQSESLRQSILKKAFAGKLVPQDVSDEPASKLLERIKEEKKEQNRESAVKTHRKKQK